MHNTDLILTLAGGLGFALLFGYITQRLGLSPIVGYLLAGVAVGPYTPGFEADRHSAEQLSEVGVILLMFGVGLHFQLKDLMAVRRIAIPGAVTQIIVATVLGLLLALGFKWGLTAGLVFGLAISVASTVVLLRVLSDNNDLHTKTGHVAVGWLIVEDLFTVLVLVMLPVLFGGQAAAAEGAPGGEAAAAAASSGGGMALALVWSLVKIVLLMVFVVVAGSRVIPWLLERVAKTKSRELFTLTVLVVALGIAVGSAKFFGVSMALGAFLAGMVVGRSDFSSRAASEALPMRDAFAVIFFVSVGMLFDPKALIENPLLVSATLAIILIGKPLAALAIVLLLGYPLRLGLAVGVVLGQIGEFSFILAVKGQELNILPDAAMDTLVAASIVSISLNPVLYRLIDWLDNKAKKDPALWKRLNTSRRVQPDEGETVAVDPAAPLVVVVGYGPVGRTLTRIMGENGIQTSVIELNLNTVQKLRGEGKHAFYGDAIHRETLHEAGIEKATALVFSSSSMENAPDAIRLAHEMNPSLRVYARVAYLHEVPALRDAGADVVFSSEGEVAMSMTDFLMQSLGATAEQMDRERERIRTELFGRPLLQDSAPLAANAAEAEAQKV